MRLVLLLGFQLSGCSGYILMSLDFSVVVVPGDGVLLQKRMLLQLRAGGCISHFPDP